MIGVIKRHFNAAKNLIFSATAKSAYITTIGGGLNSFLSFIFTVLVARSLTPADFGLFSAVLNLLIVLFVFSDLGLSSSVLRFLPPAVKRKDEAEEGRIIKTSFLITASLGIILSAGVFILAKPLAEIFFRQPALSLPLMVVSISSVGLSLGSIFVVILQARQQFFRSVVTDISVILVKLLLIAFLVFLGKLNLSSVFIAYSVSGFAGAIVGFFLVGRKFFAFSVDLKLVKILLVFGLWVTLARLFSAVSSRLDILMLVQMKEAQDVGFYAAAQKVILVFSVFIAGLNAVFSPKLAEIKDPEEAKNFLKKAGFLSLTAIFPLAVLFVFSQPIITAIYGPVYYLSGDILRWLLVATFFFVLSNLPTTALLYFFGESKTFTVICFIQLLVIFTANIFLIPRFGTYGAAAGLGISYFVTFILSGGIVYKRFRDIKI